MSDERLLLSFFAYMFLALTFMFALFMLMKMWIREMFNRYDNQGIPDIANTWEPFELHGNTKASIVINYMLFSVILAVAIAMSHGVLSSAKTITVREQEAALEVDAASLRYNYKLYEMRSNPDVGSELGSKKRIQEDGQAGGNYNKNKSRSGTDGVERGLL